ncbi:MAG: YggS family pyridoxal phosphate-dependent enzyme [Acidobacteria bacterium]|nr:MAG: YggS family pyridoxal phosphate-dependent enzyme [Acidobacteriota bacterium]
MIADNLQDVRRRIAAAAERVHRSPADVRLIAVSKTHPAATVLEAARAGQTDFGENRVQEALAKIDETRQGSGGQAPALEWHLIGHLQTNKAKKAAVSFAWIHSVDSADLVRKLDAGASDGGTAPRILIQVDLAHEATKSGADPADVPAIVEAALSASALQLTGLMIVPPIAENPEDARPWFRQLRALRDRLVASGVPAASLLELSMGMSHDFEVAIEEGATMVRVGSAIFGARDYAVNT